MANYELTVSTGMKALVEEKAKAICKTLGVENEKFNQDMNAYAIRSALVAVGVKIPDDKAREVLHILKKGGNASALRQAITATTKTEVSDKLAEELMKV